jgi:hypothetical protein
MPGPRALEALHGWVWDTREANRRSWQRYEGLKEIQYHPRLIEGCLAGTGLTLDQTENPTDIMN